MSEKTAYEEADDAFKSPTQLAAERFGTRSPTKTDGGVTPSTTRRTPEKTDPERDELMAQMAAATGVVVKVPPSSGGESETDQVSTALDRANAALATASGVAQMSSPDKPAAIDEETVPELESENSKQSSSPSQGASFKDLDMKNNDNAFHVLANLVTERFRSRMTGSSVTLEITESDIQYLQNAMQPSVRTNFVEAVRYRLENSCPDDSEAHIHVLTRQCRELWLDREGDENPLLIDPAGEKRVITVTNLSPTLDKKQATPTATSGSTPAGRPPQHPGAFKGTEVENQALRAQLEEQRRQLRQQHEDMKNRLMTSMSPRGDDNSLGDSTVTGTSDVHDSTTESLARQQLMAELREASNFMAESKTPEAASFWRQHVLELQAKLRALHGEAGAPTISAADQALSAGADSNQLAEQNVKANNRTLAGYEANKPITENLYEKKSETPPPVPLDNVENTVGALPMVDVISPANLPGGYHFEAEIDGQRFLATVPSGGVEKGETFSCVMRDLETVGEEPPVGRWRDRLSDITVHGCFHPLVWNAVLCPLIALGQIMTRIEVDWLAHPIEKRGPPAFSTMRTVIVFWLVMNALIFGAYNYKWSIGMELSIPDILAIVVLNGLTFVFAVYVTALTRQSLREKYVIPEQRCYDLEDCCCATFCMPCTVCQMGRHTADYDHYDATCCSSTGLEDNVRVEKDSYGGYLA